MDDQSDRSPAMRLVHLLRAVTVEFDLLGAEFAARNGLHPTDVRALIHLLDAARAGTRATPGWLGEQLRLNSAGTTALVDRLERLGLVRRSRDTIDRRRVLLEVEEKATELGWAFFGPVISEVMAAAEGFQASELETVRRFLTAVLESAGRARSA
ncbi:MarR family winged helix-turn-helix transcriptional regulator [Streptomyces sp. NPDC001315]|uniref:MarR family winged helix-turn-helix transcriptional regulator n=1 Tax=Streptomyces sp. NPDC001315 TaxID=3364562 RepID=UPI0036BC54DE